MRGQVSGVGGASDFSLDPDTYVKVGGHVSPNILVEDGGEYEYPEGVDAWIHTQFAIQILTGPEAAWVIGYSIYNVTDDEGRCDKGTTKGCSLLSGVNCGSHIGDPSLSAVNLGKITKRTRVRVKYWANHDAFPSAYPPKSAW